MNVNGTASFRKRVYKKRKRTQFFKVKNIRKLQPQKWFILVVIEVEMINLVPRVGVEPRCNPLILLV